jgi:3-oxoacyl-[acyl-carrier-protein] synthase III
MESEKIRPEFPSPVLYGNTWMLAAGAFLPGEPVGNDRIDEFIAPLNARSGRIKRRVLRDNGIESRHYAIDESGRTCHSVSSMAAAAVRDCLARAGVGIREVSLLCTGSSGGDTGMPGLANMLHGELGAPPMETSSHQGVCAAGVAALKHAASGVELGEHGYALVATSEFPSRLFKKSRFVAPGYETDFDSHFLRWMLSDGGGAMLLSNRAPAGVALKLKWIHMRSFSGDFPVCMQVGFAANGSQRSYLDYDSLAQAERAGAFHLRQDIRLLPHLFDVGIHEYARLVNAGYIDPTEVDHFLCHYSSEKFRGVVAGLMDDAGLAIPAERWYSNLKRRGNTGAASIFIMLADFLRERTLVPGERILCFVPESGRFTVSFLMLEATEATAEAAEASAQTDVAPPVAPPPGDAPLPRLLRDLAEVWHGYRSRMWRSPLIRRITTGTLTDAELCRWMECWIPQVREGTVWMRRAVDNLDARYDGLRALISQHASEEQFDYRMLFDDYRKAGGGATHIDALRRNAGGEALNAYMHARASERNALGLLGAIYVIEGTGQRIIPALLPMLRQQASLAHHPLRAPRERRVGRFLRYHGENDPHHLARWLEAVKIAIAADGEAVCADIVRTARATADLYALQMEGVL